MTDLSIDITRLLAVEIEAGKPSYIALAAGGVPTELVVRANRTGRLKLARQLVRLAASGGIGSHTAIDGHSTADEATPSTELTIVMHPAPWETN
jgi:hypothetical protein